MTQKQLETANEIDIKIRQCKKALDYHTHGTYHDCGGSEGYELRRLPTEVCARIRVVIAEFKAKYEKELEEL